MCPGLLLVCCDKPGTSDTRTGDAQPAQRVPRSGHARRENPPAVREALRVALKTAESIESPAVREKALADVAWSALEIDPELAREAFQQLPADGTEKLRLIQHYAMRLAEHDPDEAIAWAATLGTELEIAQAYGHIALVLAESNPERAANLLSDTGLGGHGFDVVVVQVLQRWAARTPSAAAAWVALFPPGPAREAGIKIVVGKWLQADAQAAFSWLAALQDARVRKEAALGLELAIIQQPRDIRDTWLQHADDGLRSELEQQRPDAIREVGDNIPPPAISSELPSPSSDPPETQLQQPSAANESIR